MRIRGLVTATVASLVFGGCGDAFSPEGVSGTYILVSIGGVALPTSSTHVYEGEIYVASVTSGSMVLTATGTFVHSMELQIEVNNVTLTLPLSDTGTYTLVEPSTIQFVGSANEPFGATWDGNRITIVESGGSAVYER